MAPTTRSDTAPKKRKSTTRSRDCLVRLENFIVGEGFATETDLRALDEVVSADVTDASTFADDSPFPEPEELLTDVYVRYG